MLISNKSLFITDLLKFIQLDFGLMNLVIAFLAFQYAEYLNIIVEIDL
jgi:hypothetical protein